MRHANRPVGLLGSWGGTGMMQRRRGRNLQALGWMAAGILSLIPTGCSRYDYVRDADEQAYRLVAEKSTDPLWAQPAFAVELDSRSRFFGPFDHLLPPMPPDDSAAHQFMHRIDGKE